MSEVKMITTTDLEDRFTDRSGAWPVDLHFHSFIQIDPISFEVDLANIQWIFFSSRNTVRHFLDQITKLPPSVQFGVMGPGTAALIHSYGYEVAFEGKSTLTQDVALEFSKVVGTGNILFPIGRQSLRSIQQVFPQEQYKEVICYNTIEKGQSIPGAPLMFFSSPSQVRGFVKGNEWRPDQAIAMGPNTAQCMKENNVPVSQVLKNFNADAVEEAIFSLIRS